MITQVSALQIFILIGAAQGFILAVNIFLHQRKNLGNIFLSSGIFMLSFRLLIYPFRASFNGEYWEFVQNFSLISLLMVGPCLLLFIRQRLHTNKKLTRIASLHFLPFLGYLIHLVYPHFQLPVCYSYATLYSGICYGLASTWLINGASLSNFFAKGKYHLNSFAFPLAIIPASIYGLSHLQKPILDLHPATFPYLFLTFLFYRMSFKSLGGSKIFHNQFLNTSSTQHVINPLHLNQLVEAVENEKLYLDSKISIVSLSNKTGFTRHEISHLINVGIGTSFSHFINQYRIDYFKEKLLDPSAKHLSIAGIAQESGFRSKSTFHQVFKEMTGKTPTEFQKNISSKRSEMA